MGDTVAPKSVDQFFRYFQAQNDDITNRIKATTDKGVEESVRSTALQECSNAINELSEAVRDIVDSLPAHDRQTYLNGIKNLSAELDAAKSKTMKKQKFSFKKSSLKTATVKDVASEANDTPASAVQQHVTLDFAAQADHKASIHEQSNVLIKHDFLPDSSPPASIDSLQSCIVDLRSSAALPVLRLSKIEHSVLLIPKITGPVYLEDIKHCILILGCHQFRMHNSTHCEVYLHCTSRPIIEDCTDITFAPATQIDGNSTANRWDQVDDFKWLRSEPSPNWSVLPESARRDGAATTRVDGLQAGSSPGELLEELRLP